MKRMHFYLRLIVLALMIGFAFWASNNLPDRVPMHWNWKGEIDGYSGRAFGAWFAPLLVAGMMILFAWLPKLDPKKEKYPQFADTWEEMQTAFVVFFAYIYAITIYAGLNPSVNVSTLVVGGIGFLFILIGNFMGKLRQNYFVGIKVPWTLASEDNWNKTHRLAGWFWVLAGILLIVGNFFSKTASGYAFIVAMIFSLVIPIIYSYLISRKKV